MISSSASQRPPLGFDRHASTTLSSRQQVSALSSPRLGSSYRLASRLARRPSSSSSIFFRSCLGGHDLFTWGTSGSHCLAFFHPHFRRSNAVSCGLYGFAHWGHLARHLIFRCFCCYSSGPLPHYRYCQTSSWLWSHSSLSPQTTSFSSSLRATIASFILAHCWRRWRIHDFPATVGSV